MKEKIIEAAGKTWKALGEKGQVSVSELPEIVKEKEPIVYQALGWLAREDKISYATKNKSTFVSLVESELQSFKGLVQTLNQGAQKTTAKDIKLRRK